MPRPTVTLSTVCADEARRLVHAANLVVARETPGEQPFVVGWDMLAADGRLAVLLDVDDDPGRRERWVELVGGRVEPFDGTPVSYRVDEHIEHLSLNDASMAAQLRRDGTLDRFHATAAATADFAATAEAFLGPAVFFCLESAGVRTYFPHNPWEAAMRQTIDDIARGYGGPVGYAVTAVDDSGWRRVAVRALGTVATARWEPRPPPTLGG